MDGSGKAIILFSGGLDSSVALKIAKNEFKEVLAISFKYQQKNCLELESAKSIAAAFDVPHQIIDVCSWAQLIKSKLVNEAVPDYSEIIDVDDMFVPSRNLVFLSMLSGVAVSIGASTLVTGFTYCSEQYPDTRPVFARAFERVHDFSMGNDGGHAECALSIYSPLESFLKFEVFEKAEELGILDFVLEFTHTCFANDRHTSNDWGFGCGECSTCQSRKRGWIEYKKAKSKKD